MGVSRKTKVIRVPKRGHYDKDTIYKILDEAFLCHVGIIHEGFPVVIPMFFGRDGNKIYIHGSSASRLMRGMKADIDICVTITNVHGIVLARSAYHHSMNYSSAVLFGSARLVDEEKAKRHALKTMSDHLLSGRWEDVRGPNEIEMRATTVMELDIDEASAKIRTGGPVDDEEDYALKMWAGTLPVLQTFGEPIPDDRLDADIGLPKYLLKVE